MCIYFDAILHSYIFFSNIEHLILNFTSIHTDFGCDLELRAAFKKFRDKHNMKEVIF